MSERHEGPVKTAAVLNHLEKSFDESVARLADWLRIPSVSTDPAYAPDCRRAGEWIAGQLRGLGFEAALRETVGHPVVVAHHPGPTVADAPRSPRPHVLFYGHYDVQPPDPLDLWASPPFEPSLVDGPHGKRIVARGAVDDKGQVMTFIEALRAWRDSGGGIPCRVTCLIEGEEECASVNLHNVLTQMREELVGTKTPHPCTIALVSDTGMWDIDTPAITYSLRGLVYLEVTLHGPSRDLHSGLYGGTVPNPINELARILGQLHDEDRRITLPGFYDDVEPITDAERDMWDRLNFDDRPFLAEAGFPPVIDRRLIGERGYSTLQRGWARPTCDVNGIIGGYTGQGAKTVIPTHASAKVSFRLVPHQDPAKIRASFEQWINQRLAPGCRVEIVDHGSGRPFLLPPDHPMMRVAVESLREASGVEPVFNRSGGSIPVVEDFKTTLGLDTLLIGFGLADDRVHSPNEKFELKCYALGQRTHAILLGKLAGAPADPPVGEPATVRRVKG